MADDLNLFVSRFIKLIGLAKVAAVVVLGKHHSATTAVLIIPNHIVSVEFRFMNS